MSLQSIANFVATEAGAPFATDADKAFLYDRINRAAEELYINNDLPGTLREVYVALPIDVSEVFTLPPEVYKVRGFRRPMYDARNGQTFTSQVSRYQKQTWGDIAMDNIRISGQEATSRNIIEEQNITIQLSRQYSSPVNVIICGDSAKETNLINTVTIPASSKTVTFSSPFTKITSVTKSPFFFGTVSGIEESYPGKPLFTIPSANLTSNYVKIQVQDLYMFVAAAGQYCFEMLYKPRLPIMWSPSSEFIVAQIYDQCIGWWTIAQYYKTAAAEKAVYTEMVANKLANINEDSSRGMKKQFNVGYEKHAETYDRVTWMY